MKDYVSMLGFSLLVVPLLVGLLFVLLAFLTKQELTSGWKHVKPGFGYWTVAILSFSLSLFIGVIWAFVGSSRSDAASQLSIAWWLSFLFGIAMAWSAFRCWRIKCMRLRWRGEDISFNQFRTEKRLTMRDLDSHKNRLFGSVVLTFKNGITLPIDLSASGGSELFEKTLAVNGLAEEAPEH